MGADPVPVRVLVVDDNPGDARLVEWALSREPDARYRCERADRIAVALEHLGRGEIDAVLLDLGLPDSEGTNGLRRIRERSPNVPVVVLTGSENQVLVRAAMAAGAQDYLVKGIFPAGYLSVVLRVAVLHKEVENHVRESGLPEAASLSELSARGEGVAVLTSNGDVVVNAGFSALTGFAGGSPGAAPAWLQGILRGSAGDHARGALDRAGSPTIQLGVGELVLERPGAPPVEVEYVVRRYPEAEIPRDLVFVREISAQRRGPERVHPAGRWHAPTPSAPPVDESAAPRGRDERATAGPLDAATWETLRELAGTDRNFLPALVAAYLREGAHLVGTMQSAMDDADLARIGRLAHTLKSSSAQVGALALSRECAALEYQAPTAKVLETRVLVLQVARDFAEAASALRGRYPSA